jgi:cytochrome c553
VNHLTKAILLLALAPAAALAQSVGDSDYVWNEMKGEKLLALKAKGDPLRGEISFETCQGCHRHDASGRVSGAYPRLAGQHASVLIKQMTDIRAGRRDNPKMEPFITGHDISPMEIADIAAYVQGLPISTENGKGPGTDLKRGKDIYVRDCVDCHGEHGEGSGKQFYPMVAAQHYRYLLRELHYIKDGERRNANPKMMKAIKPYNDDDIDALADYMSRQPPPGK